VCNGMMIPFPFFTHRNPKLRKEILEKVLIDDEIDQSNKDNDSEVISILRDDTQCVMEL
jgi:hypothetical protein